MVRLSASVTDPLPGRDTPVIAVAAAVAVTALDGFDAFSFSLVAPKVTAELGVAPGALGAIFASSLAGMIVGALAGGALADRIGRSRVLAAALLLFGLGALGMIVVQDAVGIIVDRVVAGVGLGAAAPVAVAQLNRGSWRPPSDFVVTLVWAGLPVGGSLAALFSYLVIPSAGWRSIFVVGGLAPLPVALFAWWALKGEAGAAHSATLPRARVADLFRDGGSRATAATAAMFFFGYITTSVVVNWLPTILAHRHASDLMVSITFASINIGGALGTMALGLLSRRTASSPLLVASWAGAGVLAILAVGAGANLVAFCALAVASATLGAGSQALSVAFANRLHRRRRLEATTVGLMIGIGRVGQVAALSVTGLLVGAGLTEVGLLGVAGGAACIAALLAMLVRRYAPADADHQASAAA